MGQMLLPYVYGCLRSYSETVTELKENYFWADPIIDMDEPDMILEKIKNPSIVGFSCYMWNWKKHIFLSEKIKKKYPKTLIVMGGPEIPERSADFFVNYPFVDVLVHSEGEVSFSELLKENLKEFPNFEKIPGISVNKDGRAIKTGPSPRIKGTLSFPSPYLLGYFDKLVEKAHEMKMPITAFWETNRGCPYSCAFCDWGNGLTRSRFSLVDDQRVFDEIDWFSANQIFNLHNCDSNFGVFPRDLKIAEKIADCKSKSGYPKVFAATYAKNSNERVFEISRIVHNAKMSYGTTLSVQSMSKKALKNISRDNIGTEKYMDLKKKYDEQNIPTYTELILGLPGETFFSWKQGFAELMESEMHEGIMVHPCGLFPNAPMAEPEYMDKHKIKTIRRPIWSTYKWEQGDLAESVSIVTQTDTMSEQEWVKMLTYGWMISVLHGGGGLRHLAIYLHKNDMLSYLDFYTKLFDYFMERPNSLLGEALAYSIKVYDRLLTDEKMNYYGYSSFKMEYKEKSYEIAGGPYNFLWMNIAVSPNKFYTEIKEFIEFCDLDVDVKLADLIRFQKELLLSPEYDPSVGKICHFLYDWVNFFKNSGPAEPCHLTIAYSDKLMGMAYDKPLIKDDLMAFRWASQAPNGARPRHYVHQEEFQEVRKAPRKDFGSILGGWKSKTKKTTFSKKDPFIY